MMRMKHLLKKLHIGGGGGEHHSNGIGDLRHADPGPLPSSASSSASGAAAAKAQGLRSSCSSSASSTSDSVRGRPSAAADGCSVRSGSAPGDFSLFEEEYQMQLALAISVSDPDGREDPESAQINAAKRMSLGCTPVVASTVGANENLVEILSQRYWNYNILDYDEKVMDGFYDVYGILTSSSQGKMPLLLDLQSASITDNVDYEVVLVDRTTDRALQQLEERAISIAKQCKADVDPSASGLIQKISDLVVNSMGGPVDSADDMLRRWTVKSYELRADLNTIVLPLGCLKVGLSRHRALLFKVLADRIELPCKLMKGSYYTGTDEGAVNLIKIGLNKEFIIDLMGAPGTLIPAEMPSCHFQNAEFDLVNSSSITQNVKDLSVALDSNTNWQLDGKEGEAQKDSALGSTGLMAEENSIAGRSGEKVNASLKEKNDTERFEHDFGKLFPSLTKEQGVRYGNTELDSPARQMKVSDVSKYVVSAAKNPDFAQKLHAVLMESGASPPPDLFSDRHSSDGVKDQRDHGKGLEIVKQRKPDILLSHAKAPHFPVPEKDTLACGGMGWDIGIQGHAKKAAQKQVEDSDLAFHNLGFYLAVAPRNELFINETTEDNDGRCVTSVPGDEMNHITSDGIKINHEGDSNHPKLVPSDAQCSAGRSVNNVDIKAVLDDVSQCEIPWEDLQIGERIGLGSYGEVYRADWNGTEVAVKKFLDQDLSGDALEQFRCEIKIMLRLRHPNVVLFMGAVTRPPNLSILTEFLPRGSLYRLLHRPKFQIDEKRRLKMAVDVAKGMNYLHTSHPTIVHRDLKSPNLLVDKNWVVKVCDFGLSRLKHHTFLSSKSTAGTPEWMAPEVLRNELSNEKCDVYSFGVILWELATLQMPWSGMNPMQVVGAVGFQNRRLDIPKEVHPMVAEIICNCWHNDPNQRPSFTQLMDSLKRLQHLVVENL